MIKPLVCSALAAVLAAAAPTGIARPRAAKAPSQELQLRAEEIVLDVIATDSKGAPVADLRPEELEVYEDGRRQEITSMRLVQVRPAAPGARPETVVTEAPRADAPAPRPAEKPINLVILVFDRGSIDPALMRPVYTAAEEFLARRLTAEDYVAVFAIDERLRLMQNFTNDRDTLLAAVRRVTALSGGEQLLTNEGDATAARNDPLTGARNLDGSPGVPDASQQIAQAALLAEQSTQFFREQFRARAIIYGLLGIMKAYGGLPGRKSVLLYSAGIPVDPALAGQMSSIVSLANRGNIAVYTVDAAGLRPPGTGPQPNPSMGVTPGADVRRDRTLVFGGNSEFGRVERSLLSDRNGAIYRLAEETGGVFIQNTNDLGKGFAALESDLRSYYLVTYAPADPARTGEFRKLDVKTTRKGVRIRSRSGYFAAPSSDGLLLPFEQPIVQALARPAASRSGGLRVAVSAAEFRADDGRWLVPVLLSVDPSGLEPGRSEKGDPVPFDIDSVAIVTAADGSVVSMLSRQTTVAVPADRVDAFRSAMFSPPPFPQRLEVPPGTYTLSIGVQDPRSRRMGFAETRLVLGATPGPEHPGMSSVVIGRSASQGAGGADAFEIPGGLRVVPEAGGRLSKSRGDRLIVYFRAYGKPGAPLTATVKASTAAGAAVLATPGFALVPDTAGEAATARAFSLDRFAPGAYMVVAEVTPPGGRSISRSATFEVVP